MDEITQMYMTDLILDRLRESGYERGEMIAVLVECLTELGVVVVYTDDTVERRANPELSPDTPMPSKK